MFDIILSTAAVQMALLWLYHRRSIWGVGMETNVGEPHVARAGAEGGELELIKAALRGQRSPQEGAETFERWLELVSERGRTWEQRIEELDALMGVERELVELTLQGMTPKEIAQYKGVSGFHIYNIRSRVRKKLGVPDDQDLGDFLRRTPEQRDENQHFTPPPPQKSGIQ